MDALLALIGIIMFVNTCDNINELTNTITDYIKFCEDMIVEKKTMKIYSNNKPWVTREVVEAARRKHELWVNGDRREVRRYQVELNDIISMSCIQLMIYCHSTRVIPIENCLLLTFH